MTKLVSFIIIMCQHNQIFLGYNMRTLQKLRAKKKT